MVSKERSEHPHHGRFQAQGPRKFDKSVDWKEKEPLKASLARTKLGALKYKLTRQQYLDRQEGFRKAYEFIENARPTGVGKTSQSWPQPPKKGGVRVDIEVITGIAFID